MKITFKEFLDNPNGKGSSVNPYRKVITDLLSLRFKKLMSRNRNKPVITFYKNDAVFYAHVLVPTEDDERDNNYDVLIEFTKTSPESNPRTLRDYNVKFFSNCPSFLFTYAHTFKKKDVLIPFTFNHFKSPILTSAPVVRNPDEVIGMDKSIFFALLMMEESHEYIDVNMVENKSAKFNVNNMLRLLRNSDMIMVEVSKSKQKKKKNTTAKINKLVNTNLGKSKISAGTSTLKNKSLSSINKISSKRSTVTSPSSRTTKTVAKRGTKKITARK